MAQAAAAMAVTGGIFQATGQLRAGNEQRRAGEAANRIAQVNARLAEEEGDAKAEQLRREGEEYLGKQRTGYAFSGVDSTMGTPLLVEAESRYRSAVDASRAHFAGRMEAAGLRYSGAEAERAGKIAQIESRYAAAGSLISSGAQGAKHYAGG